MVLAALQRRAVGSHDFVTNESPTLSPGNGIVSR
jgi:hypothetical protein